MYIHSILAVLKDFVLSYHVEIGITQCLMTQLIGLYYSEVAKIATRGTVPKIREWNDLTMP